MTTLRSLKSSYRGERPNPAFVPIPVPVSESTITTDCPATDCNRSIPAIQVFCVQHWLMLPPYTQRTLASFNALSQRRDDKFQAALAEAIGGIAWAERNAGRL